jgi:hypothetical protein
LNRSETALLGFWKARGDRLSPLLLFSAREGCGLVFSGRTAADDESASKRRLPIVGA